MKGMIMEVIGHIGKALAGVKASTLFIALFAALTAFSSAAVETLRQDIETRLQALPQHPRLFVGKDGFAALKKNATTPHGKALAERILHDANLLLDVPPLERWFNVTGVEMLQTSRAALYRMTTLSFAYAVSGDAKYAERGAKEMLAMSDFVDWNGKRHFLDTAEMTLAVSLGYDWLYDTMNKEQRSKIATAILEKGVKPSFSKDCWWVDGEGNWTAVCHCGMVAGVLAIHEDAPGLAATVIERAVVNYPKCLKASYGSKGAYAEGTMYWQYGTDFAVLMMAALDSTLGSDFRLSGCCDGFKNTGEYMMHAYGPTGLPFSYSDCWHPTARQGQTAPIPFSMAKNWLSLRYGHPEWYLHHELEVEKAISAKRPVFNRAAMAENPATGVLYDRLLPFCLLYLPDAEKGSGDAGALSYFSGNDGLASLSMHRSAWTPYASYIGIKGGTPSAGHGHMDAGSFVFESDGVRWAEDLGGMSYEKLKMRGLDIWNLSQASERWEVFRYGAKSHNILRIDGATQVVRNKALTTRFCGEKGNQFSEIDLSPMYEGQAKYVVRTARLRPDGSLVMTDILSGLAPGASVRWQMCTRAKAERISDAGIRLSRFGKTLDLEASSHPANGKWSMTDCGPLMKDYDMACAVDKDAEMLYFDVTAPESGAVELEVVFRPAGAKE